MKHMHSEWRQRLEHWVNTLKQDVYRPLQDFNFEGSLTMEHLTLDQARQLAYRPMPRGTHWGKTYEYCWLRDTVRIPPSAAGERIVMNLPTGGEAAIFVNGQPFGTYRSNWVQIPLHYLEDNFLTASARPGESFEIYVESYAGHWIGESRLGGCATGPVLPGAYQDPMTEGRRAMIGECTWGIWNEEAWQLMNIYFGGKLIQHIENLDAHFGEKYHPVRILGGRWLPRIFGKDEITVNSNHHQGVDPQHIGQGLQVVAKAEDGMVEALEYEAPQMVLGIQWHPERIIDPEVSRPVFQFLNELAAGKKG